MDMESAAWILLLGLRPAAAWLGVKHLTHLRLSFPISKMGHMTREMGSLQIPLLEVVEEGTMKCHLQIQVMWDILS